MYKGMIVHHTATVYFYLNVQDLKQISLCEKNFVRTATPMTITGQIMGSVQRTHVEALEGDTRQAAFNRQTQRPKRKLYSPRPINKKEK